MKSSKKKILECVLGAVVALALGLLIAFTLIGAIVEGGGESVKYDQVITGSGN